MGDISDMVEVGVLCQKCLQFTGDECGYPRMCEDCIAEAEDDKARAALNEGANMMRDDVYNVFMDDNTEWPMSRWCRPKYISW